MDTQEPEQIRKDRMPMKHDKPTMNAASMSMPANLAGEDGDSTDISEHNRRRIVRKKLMYSNRKMYPQPYHKYHTLRLKGNIPVTVPDKTKPTMVCPPPLVAHLDPSVLHPNGNPSIDYSAYGPMWTTSGLQPGQYGYGYQPNHTPVGSEYIEHMRGRHATNAIDRDQPNNGVTGKRQRVAEELTRAGWVTPNTAPQMAARLQKCREGKGLNLKQASLHNKRREEEELRKIQMPRTS